MATSDPGASGEQCDNDYAVNTTHIVSRVSLDLGAIFRLRRHFPRCDSSGYFEVVVTTVDVKFLHVMNDLANKLLCTMSPRKRAGELKSTVAHCWRRVTNSSSATLVAVATMFGCSDAKPIMFGGVAGTTSQTAGVAGTSSGGSAGFTQAGAGGVGGSNSGGMAGMPAQQGGMGGNAGSNSAGAATTAGAGAGGAAEPSAMLLIQNPVPANASQAVCNLPGIETLDDFEEVFFNETDVPEEERTRHCADAECHGGGYPPDLRGPNVRGALLERGDPIFHCEDVGLKLINVEQPELSMLLWRAYFPDAVQRCASDDVYDARRMPVIPGMQDQGGNAETVGEPLSADELNCLSWYVYEVARQASAVAP